MSKHLRLRSCDYFISAANTITVEKRDFQEIFLIHEHEFDEVVIVSAGNGLHIWNDNPYPITCGDVLYINAEDKHGYQSVNNLKLVNILYRRNELFTHSLVEQYLPNKNSTELERLWQITPSYLSQLQPFIQKLAIETKKPDLLSIHLAESLFLQLVILLYRFRNQSNILIPAPAQQLDDLLTALQNSVNELFNLDEFCEKHRISSRSIRRLFKAKTGMTISHYLQQLRLCKAMMLLRNSTQSISYIAAECGYDDSNYFSAVFHKVTKVTPSEYRGNFKKN